MAKHEINLSWTTILRVVATILIAFLVWRTYPILFLILLSGIFAAALYPIVAKLDGFLPRSLATLFVVLLLLFPFILLIISILTSSATELQPLFSTLEHILETASILPPAIRNIDFTQFGQNAALYVFQSTALVTGVFASVFTILFLTFFFIVEADSLKRLFLSMFSAQRRERIAVLLHELSDVNGQYMRGSLLKSFICGVTFYILFLLLGIPFAAPLAIFVAILDLLPLIGPTIGMIPAIIIAYSVSPYHALIMFIVFVIYQQFESGFLAPKIYNKTMSLSPALGFVAVVLGAQLYGVVGAFLALPVAASIPAVITFFREWKHTEPHE